MSSKIDVLRQENAKLLAENIKVKAENAKLRRAMEEHARREAENAVRLANLEQSDKEKTELIVKLNYDIREIKQERILLMFRCMKCPPGIFYFCNKNIYLIVFN